jgi:hypothetical protein
MAAEAEQRCSAMAPIFWQYLGAAGARRRRRRRCGEPAAPCCAGAGEALHAGADAAQRRQAGALGGGGGGGVVLGVAGGEATGGGGVDFGSALDDGEVAERGAERQASPAYQYSENRWGSWIVRLIA